MAEGKLTPHIVKKVILHYQGKMLVEVLEGLYLVMNLNKNCLRSHLPVHAERFWVVNVFPPHFDARGCQKALAIWPDRSSCVEGLKFNADKIHDLSVFRGDQEIINASARNRDLPNNVELVPRLMECEKMKAICEDLPPL
jgi:hypothetical protein